MSFITKRQLASLASASALVATMAVAAVPASAMAARPRRPSSDRRRLNPHSTTSDRHVARHRRPVDATGFDIGVYYSPGQTAP